MALNSSWRQGSVKSQIIENINAVTTSIRVMCFYQSFNLVYGVLLTKMPPSWVVSSNVPPHRRALLTGGNPGGLCHLTGDPSAVVSSEGRCPLIGVVFLSEFLCRVVFSYGRCPPHGWCYAGKVPLHKCCLLIGIVPCQLCLFAVGIPLGWCLIKDDAP